MDISDKEIISKYLSGDEGILSELIRRYTTPIYSFVYSLTHSAHDAEDITQETFVKVWKNIKKYDSRQSFKTWIFTIARNTTYDFLRKRKNVVFSEFENEDGDNFLTATLADPEPEVLEIMEISENKDRVRKAIQTLSIPHQEVLNLRYGEDLTFEEIGEVLGEPMNTVKSRVRRALLELKVKLAPK